MEVWVVSYQGVNIYGRYHAGVSGVFRTKEEAEKEERRLLEDIEILTVDIDVFEI